MTEKPTKTAAGPPLSAAPGAGARSALLDEFLADYDLRLCTGDKHTPEASVEDLIRMRPAILLLAEHDPDGCDRFLRRWLSSST